MSGINKLQTLVTRFTTSEKSKEKRSPDSLGVTNKIIYQKKDITLASIAHKLKKTLSQAGHVTAKYFITSKKIQDLSDLKNKNSQSAPPISKSIQFKFENSIENIQTQPAELDTAMIPQYPLVIDAVPVIKHQIISTRMQLPQQAVILKPNVKVQKISLGATELSKAKLSPKIGKIEKNDEKLLGSVVMNLHKKTNLTNTPSIHIGQHRPRLPDSEVEKRINSVKDDINKKWLDKKLSQSTINNYLDVYRERLSSRGPATSTDVKKMEDYKTVSQLLKNQNISDEVHEDTNTDQELDIDSLIDEMPITDNGIEEQQVIAEMRKNPDLYKD